MPKLTICLAFDVVGNNTEILFRVATIFLRHVGSFLYFVCLDIQRKYRKQVETCPSIFFSDFLSRHRKIFSLHLVSYILNLPKNAIAFNLRGAVVKPLALKHDGHRFDSCPSRALSDESKSSKNNKK